MRAAIVWLLILALPAGSIWGQSWQAEKLKGHAPQSVANRYYVCGRESGTLGGVPGRFVQDEFDTGANETCLTDLNEIARRWAHHTPNIKALPEKATETSSKKTPEQATKKSSRSGAVVSPFADKVPPSVRPGNLDSAIENVAQPRIYLPSAARGSEKLGTCTHMTGSVLEGLDDPGLSPTQINQIIGDHKVRANHIAQCLFKESLAATLAQPLHNPNHWRFAHHMGAKTRACVATRHANE